MLRDYCSNLALEEDLVDIVRLAELAPGGHLLHWQGEVVGQGGGGPEGGV